MQSAANAGMEIWPINYLCRLGLLLYPSGCHYSESFGFACLWWITNRVNWNAHYSWLLLANTRARFTWLDNLYRFGLFFNQSGWPFPRPDLTQAGRAALFKAFVHLKQKFLTWYFTGLMNAPWRLKWNKLVKLPRNMWENPRYLTDH
jgi:hypothetical protein